MPGTSDDNARPELTKRLLARTPYIRNACDLDLLVFLYRHPRVLLTTEQLAGFVGYSLKDIARSLDSFIEAGLLDRTAQQSLHAARMFVLLLGGAHGGGTRALLDTGSTREGRESILVALMARGLPKDQAGAGPELRLVGSV
jgi:hypothetical protein